MSLRRLTVATVVLFLACDSATTSPDGTIPPVPPAAPTAVALVISPFEAVIPLGRTRTHVATKLMTDGSRTPVRAHWMSLDPGIVSVDSNGTATGIGIGRGAIHATVDGLANYSTVTVARPTNGGTSDALIVDEFSMIEFQIPPGQGGWQYAPQIRARVRPGRAVTLLLVSFMIPDLGSIPDWNCYASLSGSESSDFNGEMYGEWSFTIGGGSRASGADVTTAITFLDDKGFLATTTVKGRIVAGDLPATVTGGNLGGACYSGYRPPG